MADSWATPRGEPGRRTDGPGQRAGGPGRRTEGPGRRAGGPAGPGTDLHLDLPRGGGTGVRDALIRALRDAVRGGRLAPGTRLPSSRSLAADLGIARNTVADAYGELVAEGWLT
ncbi:GntR family transcriptional regulator, partial [Streptomyces rhizosphaericus]